MVALADRAREAARSAGLRAPSRRVRRAAGAGRARGLRAGNARGARRARHRAARRRFGRPPYAGPRGRAAGRSRREARGTRLRRAAFARRGAELGARRGLQGGFVRGAARLDPERRGGPGRRTRGARLLRLVLQCAGDLLPAHARYRARGNGRGRAEDGPREAGRGPLHRSSWQSRRDAPRVLLRARRGARVGRRQPGTARDRSHERRGPRRGAARRSGRGARSADARRSDDQRPRRRRTAPRARARRTAGHRVGHRRRRSRLLPPVAAHHDRRGGPGVTAAPRGGRDRRQGAAGPLLQRERERELPRAHHAAPLLGRAHRLLPLLPERRPRARNLGGAHLTRGASAAAHHRGARRAHVLQPLEHLRGPAGRAVRRAARRVLRPVRGRR